VHQQLSTPDSRLALFVGVTVSWHQGQAECSCAAAASAVAAQSCFSHSQTHMPPVGCLTSNGPISTPIFSQCGPSTTLALRSAPSLAQAAFKSDVLNHLDSNAQIPPRKARVTVVMGKAQVSTAGLAAMHPNHFLAAKNAPCSPVGDQRL
jgi:hypothetical protein